MRFLAIDNDHLINIDKIETVSKGKVEDDSNSPIYGIAINGIVRIRGSKDVINIVYSNLIIKLADSDDHSESYVDQGAVIHLNEDGSFDTAFADEIFGANDIKDEEFNDFEEEPENINNFKDSIKVEDEDFEEDNDDQ